MNTDNSEKQRQLNLNFPSQGCTAHKDERERERGRVGRKRESAMKREAERG